MTIEDTLEERGSNYGDFEDNCRTTNDLMDIISEGESFEDLSPTHIEALHMICHKISRMVNGDPYYVDNVHDIIGYAKLLEEFIAKRLQEETDFQESLKGHVKTFGEWRKEIQADKDKLLSKPHTGHLKGW